MTEPKVIKATVRDGGETWHIECRFSDGQKYAAVEVDKPFEELAHKIAQSIEGEKYEFIAEAKNVILDGEKQISAWTDGLSLSCDINCELGPPAYRLFPGQKYRVTIEPVS